MEFSPDDKYLIAYSLNIPSKMTVMTTEDFSVVVD